MEQFEYEEITPNSLVIYPVRLIRGIYFLYRARELVYIGQSINVVSRIGTHLKEGVKEFDSYKYLEIGPEVELTPIEIYFIRKYKPKYNISFKVEGPDTPPIEPPKTLIDEGSTVRIV